MTNQSSALRSQLKGNETVRVCDKCFRASCWHGEFFCDRARNAGTTVLTVAHLRTLKLEHEDNWSDEKLTEVYGSPGRP